MWAIDLIKDMMKHSFYGKLTLTFEKGKITKAETYESIKPRDIETKG